MLEFDPPIALPFIPSTQKLAFVSWTVQVDGTGAGRAQVLLLDEAKQSISPHIAKMPREGLTAAQLATFCQALAEEAGKLLLPLLQENLGIGGNVGKVLPL